MDSGRDNQKLGEATSGADEKTKQSAGTLEAVWNEALSHLQQELDPQIFDAYVQPLKLASFDSEKSEIIVRAPSLLLRDRCEKLYSQKISDHISNRLALNDVQMRVEVAHSPSGATTSQTRSSSYVVVKKFRPSPPAAQGEGDGFETHLNPKYDFDNFVVGSSNQFCHAAARQVAEGPGQSYNPLFIYGGVGLGKTHLLHAIGNQVLKNGAASKVLYMSAETFMNDLIKSLRLGKMDEFKNRLRNIETLLIDDIQFISGKERTQEEFFHTFNALHNAKRQIVVTSDKIPQEIPGLEERLKTRFAWGLTADLQSPDFETRVAILNRRAALDGFSLPREVAHLIAEHISSNVRELEGALTRLMAKSSLEKVSVTEELAKVVLKPLLEPKAVALSIDDIKKAVCAHFHLKLSDLSSKRRTRNLSFPRHIAMYLCRKHTTASYPEIGTLFGGRDHSSVIHAANVVARKIDSDDNTRGIVEELERVLKAC